MKFTIKNKNVLFYLLLCVAGLVVFLPACIKEKGNLPTGTSSSFCDSLNVRFSTDILPIFVTECANPGCHSQGGGTTGVDLSDYNKIKPYADQGRIKARVLDGNTNGWMPTAGPLPLAQRQKIDCWLKAGAPDN